MRAAVGLAAMKSPELERCHSMVGGQVVLPLCASQIHRLQKSLFCVFADQKGLLCVSADLGGCCHDHDLGVCGRGFGRCCCHDATLS